MKIQLSARANLDFNQAPLGIKSRWVEVKSLKEASEVAQTFLRVNGLGSGNWTGGQVKVGGKVVARISYNGRAWEPGNDSKEIELT